MDDLYSSPIERPYDIILLVGMRTDMVLCEGKPAIDVYREIGTGCSQQYAQGNSRTVHVLMHAMHVTCRLQVMPPGIEADTLAHQGDCFILFFHPPPQVHNGRIFGVAPLSNRDKSACAHLA